MLGFLIDIVHFQEKFAFRIARFATQHFFATHSVQLRYEVLLLMMDVFDDGHFSWTTTITMLLTQCAVHIWNYSANTNHNVQFGVAKDRWVAKLVLQNAIFSQKCTTSNEIGENSFFNPSLRPFFEEKKIFFGLLCSEGLFSLPMLYGNLFFNEEYCIRVKYEKNLMKSF